MPGRRAAAERGLVHCTTWIDALVERPCNTTVTSVTITGMDTTICFECGAPAVHQHHVVPRSLGGTRTVPLCLDCHGKVHGRRMAAPELVRKGLASAKARGVLMGAAHPNGCRLSKDASAKGPRAAAAKRSVRARDAYADLAPRVAGWRAEGLSLRAIAARLDAAGQTTRGGKAWNPVQVNRVLKYSIY
jgi:hypothetical protein